jgi:hypothetical protein
VREAETAKNVLGDHMNFPFYGGRMVNRGFHEHRYCLSALMFGDEALMNGKDVRTALKNLTVMIDDWTEYQVALIHGDE